MNSFLQIILIGFACYGIYIIRKYLRDPIEGTIAILKFFRVIRIAATLAVGLIYLVLPIDIIPDVLIPFGWIDDIAVFLTAHTIFKWLTFPQRMQNALDRIGYSLSKIGTRRNNYYTNMEEKKSLRSRISNAILLLAAFVTIPAGIATTFGYSLKDLKSDCLVPRVVGDSEAMAIFSIQQTGLKPIINYVSVSNIEDNVVYAQKPNYGETVKNCDGSVYIEINTTDKSKIKNNPIINNPSSKEQKEGLGFWQIAAIIVGFLLFLRFLELFY